MASSVMAFTLITGDLELERYRIFPGGPDQIGVETEMEVAVLHGFNNRDPAKADR